MTQRHERGYVLQIIKQLAARPEGVTTAELLTRLQASSRCPYLCNAGVAGHVFKADRPGFTTHWFLTPDAAAAWVALGARPKAPRRRPGRPKKTETVKRAPAVRAKPGKKQQMQVKAHPAPVLLRPDRRVYEPEFTERTVYIIDTVKRANNRIEAAPALPADPRWPSFAATRPGVNPETRKAWGQA